MKREYVRASEVSEAWVANLKGHIQVAREYGLTDEEISSDVSSEELLAMATQILSNIPENPISAFSSIDAATKESVELESHEALLSDKIGVAKKRLNDIKSLKSGFSEYSNTVKKRVDRLHISQWMDDLALQVEACPACGSKDHPKSANELQKISAAFRKYEVEAKTVSTIPTSFSREEEGIKRELEDLLEQQKSFRYRYDLVVSRDRKTQEQFQKRKSMYFFLGHLKASAETFESLTASGELKREIDALQIEYDVLDKQVDQNAIKRRVDAASLEISQGILTHLKSLDVEEKYKTIAPKFSVKDLNIQVLSSDSNWHFLAEVGSASNWVSFHIALMSSLQAYFSKQESSCVPNFVIFDQPSQVYFPKVMKDVDDVDMGQKYEDEDIEAVKKIFRTISNAISQLKGAWQAIILDHADSSIYGDIEGIHEAVEFRYGKKLIPVEWYTE